MTDRQMRQLYLDWPHEISIETFAKCNASCTFCPYTTLDRIGTKMPDEMIDRIIEELKDHPWPFMIAPFKVNEPLLDKRLIPICRKINWELPKAHLRLFSNGSALTEKHIADIATLDRVVHFWVSLNEHEAEAYNAVMGLDFERTCHNLDRLHEAVECNRFPHPVVISKVRECNETPTERDRAFEAFVNERWPRFNVCLIKRDGWIDFTEPGSKDVPDASCGRWYELSIMATGKVSLCCMDGTGEHSIGDLNEQSLFEAYNSRHWRERRVKDLSRKCLSPCDRCTY
ncbi:MAG: radical SAM protein [Rhizobium sp.]|nr:MAG: radical SAM protein [Rhizobium sp.]